MNDGQLEERVDLTPEVTAKISQAEALASENGGLGAAVELLMTAEKSCRLVEGTAREQEREGTRAISGQCRPVTPPSSLAYPPCPPQVRERSGEPEEGRHGRRRVVPEGRELREGQ